MSCDLTKVSKPEDSPASISFTAPEQMHIGIIGGGITGLFTAYLLAKQNIKFTILEADSKCGGRLFTYDFSNVVDQRQKNGEKLQREQIAQQALGLQLGGVQVPTCTNANVDQPELRDKVTSTMYSDMGAMRFPINALNAPVWKLFDEIGLELKPYYYDDLNRAGKVFFNNQQLNRGNNVDLTSFGVQRPGGGNINHLPEELQNWQADNFVGPNHPFGDLMVLRSQGFEFDTKTQHDFYKSHWNFSQEMIDLLETIESATGHSELSSFEHAIHSICFTPSEPGNWGCIPGGTREFVIKMLQAITAQCQRYNQQGSSIYRNAFVKSISKVGDEIKVQIPENNGILSFSHVICTASLPSLSNVDLSALGLSFLQTNTVRTMQHDHSVKIALSFSKRWWEEDRGDEPANTPIYGGKSMTDLPLRIIVYPSYGFEDPAKINDNIITSLRATNLQGKYINIRNETVDPDDAVYSYQLPGTILASYSWGQDAEYLASQFVNGTLSPDSQFASSIFEQLGKVHEIAQDELRKLCTGIFCWDWHNYSLTTGPFSMFAPNQFSKLKHIMQGGIANNRFQFAGEGSSVHHGWVIGCMKSSLQALLHIFDRNNYRTTRNALIGDWKLKMCLLEPNNCTCPNRLQGIHLGLVSQRVAQRYPNFHQILCQDKDIYLPVNEDHYNQELNRGHWVRNNGSFRFTLNPPHPPNAAAQVVDQDADQDVDDQNGIRDEIIVVDGGDGGNLVPPAVYRAVARPHEPRERAQVEARGISASRFFRFNRA